MPKLIERIEFDAQRLAEDVVLKGWNQHELAVRAGVSDPTVANFLSGRNRTAKTCKKLAAALGYSIRRYVVPRETVPA